VNGQIVTPWPGFRYIGHGNVGPTYRPDADSFFGGGYNNESGFHYNEPYVLPNGSNLVCIQAQSEGFYDTIGCSYVNGLGVFPPLQNNVPADIKSLTDRSCWTPAIGTGELRSALGHCPGNTWIPIAVGASWQFRLTASPNLCAARIGNEIGLVECVLSSSISGPPATQVFTEIPQSTVANTFMISVESRCVLIVEGTLQLGDCNPNDLRFVWADTRTSGAPPTGTIPQPQEELNHLVGSLSDDYWEADQLRMQGVFMPYIIGLFQGSMTRSFEFVNVLHKSVQVDIWRQLMASGKQTWMECKGLGRTFPDLCSPERPQLGYRHAEVKPNTAWSIEKGRAQLTARDNAAGRILGSAGSYRARAVDGWPTAGRIELPGTPLWIRYELLEDGLYVYTTNLTDVVQTVAAAVTAFGAFKAFVERSTLDNIKEFNRRWPPASPKTTPGWVTAAFLSVTVASGVVLAVAVGVVSAPVVITGGVVVGGGALILDAT
jgi:hypothetical protein